MDVPTGGNLTSGSVQGNCAPDVADVPAFAGVPDRWDLYRHGVAEVTDAETPVLSAAEHTAPKCAVGYFPAFGSVVPLHSDTHATGVARPIPVRCKRGRSVGSTNRLRKENATSPERAGGDNTAQVEGQGEGETTARKWKRFSSMQCLSIAKSWVYH